jgi:hypothetical protein
VENVCIVKKAYPFESFRGEFYAGPELIVQAQGEPPHAIFIRAGRLIVLSWPSASCPKTEPATSISGILLAYEIRQIMQNANLSGFGTKIV